MHDAYNEFIARHEVGWELTMACLTIVFVLVGFAGDDSSGRMADTPLTIEAVPTKSVVT